ncbi:MAG: hypothetical protein ABSH50_29480 [Bryobacteraceae bacterium]
MASLRLAEEREQQRSKIPRIAFCEEKKRLLQEFLDSVRELLALQNQQTQAVINEDPDFARFDILMHAAQEKKERAKYAWIAHVEQHHCDEEEHTHEPDKS